MCHGTNKYAKEETVKDCQTCGYEGGSVNRCNKCKIIRSEHGGIGFWKPKKDGKMGCSTCKPESRTSCELCQETKTLYEPYPFWKPKK